MHAYSLHPYLVTFHPAYVAMLPTETDFPNASDRHWQSRYQTIVYNMTTADQLTLHLLELVASDLAYVHVRERSVNNAVPTFCKTTS